MRFSLGLPRNAHATAAAAAVAAIVFEMNPTVSPWANRQHDVYTTSYLQFMTRRRVNRTQNNTLLHVSSRIRNIRYESSAGDLTAELVSTGPRRRGLKMDLADERPRRRTKTDSLRIIDPGGGERSLTISFCVISCYMYVGKKKLKKCRFRSNVYVEKFFFASNPILLQRFDSFTG